MLERVAKTISRYNMLPHGSRVIAAVSGGADSVCLLHVLKELAAQAGLHLEVAHYNHRWRGEESEGDERFVRELAAKLNLRLHVARTSDADIAGNREGNQEQIARRARQAFFKSVIENSGKESGIRIATGHTRDDQAETVLLRLLRGSGLAGLAGILPVTAADIVRPLLDVTRAEILQYLRERNIPWREDSSNRDLKFARNRVRHELLPQLTATWNPHLTDALAHLADLSYEEERWWAGPASPVGEIWQSRAGGVELHVDSLAALSRAVARRTIRRAIAKAKGDLRQVEFDHVERVLELAGREAGDGRILLPGLDVQRSFDWIRLAVPANTSPPLQSVEPIALTIPGSYACPDGKSLLRLEFAEGRGDEDKQDAEGSPFLAPLHPRRGSVISTPLHGYRGSVTSPACATFGTAVLGLDQIPGDLQLRGWRPGDRYRPLGHTRVRKVAEMFAEARIPSWQRRQWPMVMSGERIVWARQFGAAAEFAADKQADRVLRISEVGS
jgi:tRNA(Ile)-lysidine synthase